VLGVRPPAGCLLRAHPRFRLPPPSGPLRHPYSAPQLDLAVLDDDSNVRLLGEAKKETKDLDKLERGLLAHLDEVPEPRRGDEPRQLAWRLFLTRAEYLWLVGPADGRAFVIGYDPLRISRLDRLPRAVELGLEQGPAAMMQPPVLRSADTGLDRRITPANASTRMRTTGRVGTDEGD